MRKSIYLLVIVSLLPVSVMAERDWRQAFPIQQLSPKRKIGGFVRFNDPSFFYAEQGKLVTNQGRYKRHRTFMFPHLKMTDYPYKLRIRVRKRDSFPVMAGIIFGAKTPYEFEMGSEQAHGALFAYVGSRRVEFRDHRTYGTDVWKGSSWELSAEWRKDEEITLELEFSEAEPHGTVQASVTGAIQGAIAPVAIDLGKPDEMTNNPHIRGKGYWGFSVHGRGEVEILDVSYVPGANTPQDENLDAYVRPCEWCVLKQCREDYITLTFALREAQLYSFHKRNRQLTFENNPIMPMIQLITL